MPEQSTFIKKNLLMCLDSYIRTKAKAEDIPYFYPLFGRLHMWVCSHIIGVMFYNLDLFGSILSYLKENCMVLVMI